MIDQVRNYLSGLSRPTKRSIQLLFDFVALALVAVASYMLRLGVSFTPSLLQIGFVVLAPLVAIPVFIRLGLYRAILRYLPEKASWTIVKAMSLATLLWVMLIFLTEMSGLQGVPRSIPVIYWALGIIVVGGSRFAAKSFFLPLVRDLPRFPPRPRLWRRTRGHPARQCAHDDGRRPCRHRLPRRQARAARA